MSSFVFILLGIYNFIQVSKSVKKPAKNGESSSLTAKEEKRFKKTSNSFLAGLIAILTMEMGDKTQVATIVLAVASASFVGTLIGAWGALSSLAIIGAYAGKWLSENGRPFFIVSTYGLARLASQSRFWRVI